MKNIFENWKAYITEQLLIESRLKDAIALATNFKKRLPRDMLEAISRRPCRETEKSIGVVSQIYVK